MPSTRGPSSTTDAGRCTVYTDGGARGNPGPAAAGGVILAHDGTVLDEVSAYLGIATNNVAEYRALILTLERALELGCRRIAVKMDSELVVKQLAGSYRVKDGKMIPLHAHVLRLLAKFEDKHIAHVRRDENKRADKLVNSVLDERSAAPAEERAR